MSRKGILLMAMLLALALVSAACGSDSNNETGSDDEQSQAAAQGDEEESDAEDDETDEATDESAEATYVATEFAFEGPDMLSAGNVTVTMDNKGKQMHELALGELLQGKTIADVHALLKQGLPKKPPKWFRDVGGTGAKPGSTGSLDAELTPGNYIMLCFVPDKASKKPHVMLGMMKEVTVE